MKYKRKQSKQIKVDLLSWRIMSGIGALFSVFFSTNTYASTVQIQSKEDATINSLAPDDNLGVKPNLEIGADNGVARTIVKFSLSDLLQAGIAADDIKSAVLEFDINLNAGWPEQGEPDDFAIAAHHLEMPWRENDVSWNCSHSCSAPWDGGNYHLGESDRFSAVKFENGQLKPVDGKMQFDITHDLVDVLNGGRQNFGWLIKKVAESNESGSLRFASRESGAAPLLVVSLKNAIDVAPPTLTISEPKDQIYVDEQPQQITLNYWDDVVGVDVTSLTLSLDGQSINNRCGNPDSTSVTCDVPDNLARGNHVLVASIRDLSGKVTETSASFTFLLEENAGQSKWVGEAQSVHTTAKVGIGTQTPVAELDVLGNAAISGDVSANSVSTLALNADTLTVGETVLSNQTIETKTLVVNQSVVATTLTTETAQVTQPVDPNDDTQVTNVGYVSRQVETAKAQLQAQIGAIPKEDTTDELQTLSVNGLKVTLSQDGGSFSVEDNDGDATNELQMLFDVLKKGSDAGGLEIRNIGLPTHPDSAASKRYVDAAIQAALGANQPEKSISYFQNRADFNSNTSTRLIENFESWSPKDKPLSNYSNAGVNWTVGTNLWAASPGYTNFGLAGRTQSTILTSTGDEVFTMHFTFPVTAVGMDTYLNTHGPTTITISFVDGSTERFLHAHPATSIGFWGVKSITPIASIKWETTLGRLINTGIDNLRVNN